MHVFRTHGKFSALCITEEFYFKSKSKKKDPLSFSFNRRSMLFRRLNGFINQVGRQLLVSIKIAKYKSENKIFVSNNNIGVCGWRKMQKGEIGNPILCVSQERRHGRAV